MPTGKLSGKVAIVTGGARAVSVFIIIYGYSYSLV